MYFLFHPSNSYKQPLGQGVAAHWGECDVGRKQHLSLMELEASVDQLSVLAVNIL